MPSSGSCRTNADFFAALTNFIADADCGDAKEKKHPRPKLTRDWKRRSASTNAPTFSSVIPAKAGIQCLATGTGSRFSGNSGDWTFSKHNPGSLWTAPAERSGDGALAPFANKAPDELSCLTIHSKARSRFACRRSPKGASAPGTDFVGGTYWLDRKRVSDAATLGARASRPPRSDRRPLQWSSATIADGTSALRAPESAFGQRGGSPLQAGPLRPVTDCNCVAMRRGGEQQEVNDQSVGHERDSA